MLPSDLILKLNVQSCREGQSFSTRVHTRRKKAKIPGKVMISERLGSGTKKQYEILQHHILVQRAILQTWGVYVLGGLLPSCNGVGSFICCLFVCTHPILMPICRNMLNKGKRIKESL